VNDLVQTTLGTICLLTKGTYPTERTQPGRYPLIVTAESPRTSDSFQIEGEAVCIPVISSTGHGHASLKRVHYARGQFAVANLLVAAQPRPDVGVDARWLWLYLDHYRDRLIVPLMRGTANVSLKPAQLAAVPIHLPPLAAQRRIVDLIGAVDRYSAEVLNLASRADAALRAMLREWTTPNSTSVPLTTVVDVLDTMREPVNETERSTRPGSVPYYGAAGRVGWIDRAIFDEPLVLLGEDGAGLANWATKPIAYMVNGPAWVNNHAHVLRPRSVPQAWLYMSLRHHDISGLINTGTRPKLNKSALEHIQINVSDDIVRRTELLVEVESQVTAAQGLQEATALVRAGLLSRLISGDASIPKAYDRFLGGAA
jgi:type I restriction enzyme, S subunit